MQRYNTSMAQIQEQMLVNEYMDSVLALDEDQFIEYYDSLTREQQEELNEFIGKIAKGIGKIAVAPITLPYKVVKGVGKGVGKAVTSNPAKKAAGLVGKGAAALAKGAGKAAKAAVVNKQGNVRFSTAGRADAAKKKADAIAKRNDERERLAKEKERIAKERERAKKLKGDQGTDARADVAKQQRALGDKEKEVAQKSKAEIDKEKKESVEEGKMSQMHMMIKQKKTPEQIARALKLDLKTVKALMKEEELEESISVKPYKNARDPSKKGLEINKSGGMRGSIFIKDKKELRDLMKKLTQASRLYNIKEEVELLEAVDSDDTGGAAEVDMIMNQVNQMRHFLDGIEKMVQDDGDVEEWVQGKITKATDYLKTAYSYKTGEKNEATDLEEFTTSQMARLKKEYEPLRGKETGINPEKFKKLRGMMRRFPKANLLKLAQADIPILSSAAKASLVVNHGMKWKQLPEELVPYISFEDNLQEKFVSVDDKVLDRIKKMMKGPRQERESLANLMNYFMPPEVVDMVRDKFNIRSPRGRIKISDFK